MKKFLGILVLGFLSSCSDDNSTSNKISLGSKVYSNVCSSCHETGRAPNSSFYTLELSDIVDKVIYGGEGMPSFKNTLTTNEIEAVAYYIYKMK